jgi:single-stranded-DNA-specific exonuclease
LSQLRQNLPGTRLARLALAGSCRREYAAAFNNRGFFVGQKFASWTPLAKAAPSSMAQLFDIIRANREFVRVDQLTYGDYGLLDAAETVSRAIRKGRRIALYADYDVDGTMSCVSWIWFLEAIGYRNYTFYIPCRFEE